MDITVFGTGTSGHQFIINTIEEVLVKANIDFNILEDTDVQNFINLHVKSIPSVRIDNEIPISLKQNGEFNQSLRKIVFHILKKVKFGDYPKYIVPIDFSNTSKNAFYYGHRIATETGAIVKLLHVYHPTANELSMVDSSHSDPIQSRKEELDEFVQKVDVDWGSDIMKAALVDKEFKVGFPGEVILDNVKENNAKLLIVGATGEGGLLKNFFGSVSTKLMNDASCPVLVVPDGANYGGIHNILFTCAQQNESEKILDEVVAFGSKFNATIHFLHVSQHGETPFNEDFVKEIDDKLPEHKYKIINLSNPEIEHTIIDYAEKNDIDIIVMGTKRRTFIDSLLHSSVSKKVKYLSKIPLLIIN